MDSRRCDILRIIAFTAMVMIGTAVRMVAARWIVGSWAVGATTSVIAGGLLLAPTSGETEDQPVSARLRLVLHALTGTGDGQ